MIKVLVVDDDKLARTGLISVMPWSVFDMKVVGEARNGEKALEFLESNEVDLLLTDLSMPIMSGIELMRIVRKRYPSIHIVVLTLHQDFEYVQEALRLGAIDYIAKMELEKEHFEEVLGRIHSLVLDARMGDEFIDKLGKPTEIESSGKQQYSEDIFNSIMMAVKIVQEELDQPLFAVEVTKRVNMSRSYFNQCFKDIVGHSFNEYLRLVRIEKAKEYLIQTNKPIQWIAEQTGYMDYKYFSRIFYEQTNLHPSVYRKNNKH